MLVALALLIVSTEPPNDLLLPKWECTFAGKSPALRLAEPGELYYQGDVRELPEGTHVLLKDTAEHVDHCLAQAERLPAKANFRIIEAQSIERNACASAIDAIEDVYRPTWFEHPVVWFVLGAATVAAGQWVAR